MSEHQHDPIEQSQEGHTIDEILIRVLGEITAEDVAEAQRSLQKASSEPKISYWRMLASRKGPPSGTLRRVEAPSSAAVPPSPQSEK
jgi:hypothetical protein